MKKKKENDSVTRKMTVYEYEAKYSEKESRKKARGILNTLTFVLAVFLFLCAFFLFKEFYAINRYAGYVAAALLAVLYFVFFILPIVRIRRAEAFETQVNVHSLLAAKRHNAKVRKNLADKITDCYLSVDECEWYSDASVKTLMLARRSGDDGQLKTALNAVYEGDVKRAAHLLDGAEDHASPRWNLLRGKCHMTLEEFPEAATCFLAAEGAYNLLRELEICYREMGDYKNAYIYACRQKDTN